MTADTLQEPPAKHHSHGTHHGHGRHAEMRKVNSHTPAPDEDLPDVGYPRGHIGYLSDDEDKALTDFKAYITEQGLYKPGPPASHDDQTLLRFLRARRWVVLDAYKQFKDTEDWRKANQIETLYATIDRDGYEQSRVLYPQWTGRRDRRGIPLYLFEIRHLDTKTITAYEKTAEEHTWSRAERDPSGKTPRKLLPLFALYENLTRFAQPLCTEMTDREHSKVPITLSTNIVDVSQVSLKQFWNLKGHMQAASQLATAHYPETLDRIFIIGAPFFFSTVWGWIKRWFDPITVSKIFILSHAEVLPTLKNFIDPRNIPKQYGGELEFHWGEMPNLDPSIVDAVDWAEGSREKAFPKGPVYWRPLEGDDSRLECIAVGSVNKDVKVERVATMKKTFRGPRTQEAARAAKGGQVPQQQQQEEHSSGEKAVVTTGVESSATEVQSEPAGAQPAVTTGVDTSATDAQTEAKPKADQSGEAKSEPIVTEVQGVQNLTLEEATTKA